MVILTLKCDNPDCGLTVIVGSKDRKAAEAIFDYGKINPVTGKVREFNCLMCGLPMVKAGVKPKFSKILSDSNKGKYYHSKDKELLEPAEMINSNE